MTTVAVAATPSDTIVFAAAAFADNRIKDGSRLVWQAAMDAMAPVADRHGYRVDTADHRLDFAEYMDRRHGNGYYTDQLIIAEYFAGCADSDDDEDPSDSIDMVAEFIERLGEVADLPESSR